MKEGKKKGGKLTVYPTRRLVAKFNHTQTVGDIRRYINGTRPTDRSYILQTTFPVKELTDETQTLKDAGLMNTVVVQRYQ